MHGLATFVTDFGDLAITAPLAAVTAAFLAALRLPRLLLAWLVSIGLCAAVIGGLKLVLSACGHRFAIAGFVSPSGHAAMSAAVFGGLAVLIGHGRSPSWRRTLFAATAALVVVIAATRVLLDMHSLAEAAVGLAIGLLAVAPLGREVAAHRRGALPVRWLAAGVLVLAVAAHGSRWHTERTIHELAGSVLVRWLIPGCR